MTETKQEYGLTVRKDNSIIRSYQDAENVAKAMAGSGFFQDSKQASQAIVKVLAGHELGFGPFASMTGIHIIQGKPAIGANLIAGAIKASGKYDYRIIILDDSHCEIEFYQIGNGKPVSVGKSAFSIEDAKKAGLTNKDNWAKFPRNMVFSRAISNGSRWYCPDVFSGAPVYTPEELGADTDMDGNVIDAVIVEEKPALIEEPAPEVPLDNLPDMSLELAENEVNSKGVRYGDLASDRLAYMYNAILKHEKTDANARKLDAIKVILNARNA